MMSRPLVSLASIILALLLLAPAANAGPIAPSDFGPDAVFESFEAVPMGPNNPIAPYYVGTKYKFLQPGINEPYTFPSGATMTGPIPNPGVIQGILLADWALGPAYYGLGAGNSIMSPADVAFGIAYLCRSGNRNSAPLEFTFDKDMIRVGAYVTSLPGVTITLSAYDADGVLIEAVSIPAAPIGDWRTNFLGLEADGIRKITFDIGKYGVLDGLTFEADPTPRGAPVTGIPEIDDLLLVVQDPITLALTYTDPDTGKSTPGAYVSKVAEVALALRKSGKITQDQFKAIMKAAANSKVNKPNV